MLIFFSLPKKKKKKTGDPPLTRRLGPVRPQSHSAASGPRCFHRGQKRTVPAVSAHRIQKHEEVSAEVQVDQRGSSEGPHDARSRRNGVAGCQRYTVPSPEETRPQGSGHQKLRVRKNDESSLTHFAARGFPVERATCFVPSPPSLPRFCSSDSMSTAL